MANGMVRKHVYITPEQEEQLRRLAEDRGCTEAQVLREGLQRTIEDARETTPEAKVWAKHLEFLRTLTAEETAGTPQRVSFRRYDITGLHEDRVKLRAS